MAAVLIMKTQYGFKLFLWWFATDILGFRKVKLSKPFFSAEIMVQICHVVQGQKLGQIRVDHFKLTLWKFVS